MVFETPSWRHDLVREVDLIEEIARLEGFDKIPSEQPKMNISPGIEQGHIDFQDRCRSLMAQQGLCEVITLPFLAESDSEKMNIDPNHPMWPRIKLENAINEEISYLQTTQAIGLIKSVKHNRDFGKKGSKLFEMGRGFYDFEKIKNDLDQYSFFERFTHKEEHLTHKAHLEKSRPIEKKPTNSYFRSTNTK